MDELSYRFATKEYVQARIAEAMHLAGGGKQIKTFSGNVELTNMSTQYMTIPVDVSDATMAVVLWKLVATGDVSGGVVTLDSEPTIKSVDGQKAVIGCAFIPIPEDSVTVKNDDGTKNAYPQVQTYSYIKNTGNASTGGDTGSIVDGTTIKLHSLNRYFCVSDRYSKYAYTVIKV